MVPVFWIFLKVTMTLDKHVYMDGVVMALALRLNGYDTRMLRIRSL